MLSCLDSPADNNIRVVVRFRPQNRREIQEGGLVVVEVDKDDEAMQDNLVKVQVRRKCLHGFGSGFSNCPLVLDGRRHGVVN